MKIFLIIPTLRQGGAERVISELANEFCALGHHVELALLADGSDFYKVNPKIKTHRLGFTNLGVLSKLINEMKLFLRLRNLLKREVPDAVLSFGDKYNVFTLLATRHLGLNIFISDRSNPRKVIPKLTESLRKLTYSYATGIIAQTTLAQEVLIKKTGNQNISVIPNPLKLIGINENIPREKIILNVGRLVPEKGHFFLLQIFSEIKDPNWKLVILGEGPLRNDLEKQAQLLEIEDRLIMPGSVANVDEWLAKSSIFAFSSISEGFPNALVEAMAAGLPAVSFDCDAGPRDIINDGENGFIVPVKDINAMTSKLDALIQNPLLREEIGMQAKQISSILDKRIIAEKYLKFITKSKLS